MHFWKTSPNFKLTEFKTNFPIDIKLKAALFQILDKRNLTHIVRIAQFPICLKMQLWDFPGGAVVKNTPANAGDKGSSPGPGKS